MSLYNSVMGVHPTSYLVLGILRLEKDQLDQIRFRDAQFIDPSHPRMLLFTRLGVVEDYADQIKQLQSLDHFVRDYVEKRDSTFRSFEYQIPDDIFKDIKKLLMKQTDNGFWNHPMERYWDMISQMDKNSSSVR